jgi:hypothetical protein
VIWLLLFACSDAPAPPPVARSPFAAETAPFLGAARSALTDCGRAVAPLGRGDRSAPDIPATAIREACDPVVGLDDLWRPRLVGRSRDVDQLLSGMARVEEDVRIYELEQAQPTRDPHTVKGAVDHLVDSVPAILAVAERLAREGTEPSTRTPAPRTLTAADASSELGRLRASVATDLGGLSMSLVNLGWSNRTSPERVRNRSFAHLRQASRARLAEARGVLGAITPADDGAAAELARAAGCVDAGARVLATFESATLAYAEPDTLEPADWDAWKALVESAQASHLGACGHSR